MSFVETVHPHAPTMERSIVTSPAHRCRRQRTRSIRSRLAQNRIEGMTSGHVRARRPEMTQKFSIRAASRFEGLGQFRQAVERTLPVDSLCEIDDPQGLT